MGDPSKHKHGDERTTADADQLKAKPDEARMSEIAKRLLSTPPDRQSVGKALAPKKQ